MMTSEKDPAAAFSLRNLANMVNKCVAAGCSNGPSDKISLFKFPKNPASQKGMDIASAKDTSKLEAYNILLSLQ